MAMAVPASKRRKTTHVSSDEESDNASFASFSDDEEQAGLDGRTNGAGTDEPETSEEEEDTIEGADNDLNGDATRAAAVAQNSTPVKIGSATKENRNTRNKVDQLGASAYVDGTFKSNIFKLQVDELLGQIRPIDGKREVAAERALHALKKSIEQIPARGPSSLLDAERSLLKEKIAIPWPDPPPPQHAKYKFAYAKPVNINVVGSFALKTSSRSRGVLEVDMMLAMPGSVFEDKDYLNHRYFYKRAYYLACIASGLKATHKSEYSFHFKLLHDDCLKPVLVVGPPKNKIGAENAPSLKWTINIIPGVVQDQFLREKLSPDRNCIRTSNAANGDANVAMHPPTAFYNSSLRSDMLPTPYLKLLHGAAKSCDAFVDACLLGSTWLRQRGFGSALSEGGFGNFEWSALMALCLEAGGPSSKPLLSLGYSSYQLFKATLQLLAVKDFVKQPLVIGQASATLSWSNRLPLLWDSVRSHNLLYKVQSWSYKLLRYEARSSLNILGDQLHDGFEPTFILRVNEPLYRFDHVIAIPLQPLISDKRGGRCLEQVQNLYHVLKEGMSDRVNQISFTLPSHESWELGSSPPTHGIKGQVMIGLIVNPDTIRRTVDHGPSAEEKADTAAFRKFWGEKAELRRFKDGRILESLVWDPPQVVGRSVLEQIVHYLLGLHFGLVTTEDFAFHGDGFSQLVRGGADRIVFESLVERYRQFENDVRELRELPLSIRQIMPADPQLRYASSETPNASKVSQRSIPADVTIQFEGSSRWPDDLAAIQRTKTAFLLMISDLLQGSVNSVTTRLGLENEGQEVLNQGYLDVTCNAEATFRLRIFHEREQALHERRLKDKSVDPKSREISAVGLAKYKRDYLKAPAHTQAIARLCIRFPVLSGSIRLMKRWFASHLLSNHIADEVIELLVVRTFTYCWPWQTPSSVQTAFLRTVFWISRWDWRSEPLVVDVSASGELKRPELQAINTNFEAWRKLDPAMNRVALFVATNLDHDGNTWTDHQPAKVVASRMTALAKSACAELAAKQLQLEPASLFSSPVDDFDFVLHLDPVWSGGSSQKTARNGTTFKNLELDDVHDADMVGFDPIRDFGHELDALYGSAILFFHGRREKPVIAGLWSPLTARRAWKVNLAYSTIPTRTRNGEDDAQATLNRAAILAEIARLGGDLIVKVETFEH